MKRNWARDFSRSNYIPSKYRRHLNILIKSFLKKRDLLFMLISKKFNVKIPQKTKNNTFLFEEIAVMLPADAEKEKEMLKDLIRLREHIVACLIPLYQKLAVKHLLIELKAENLSYLHDPRIDQAIYKGAVRSLERMKEPGIRIDFVGTYLKRAISSIRFEMNVSFSINDEEKDAEYLFEKSIYQMKCHLY